MKVQWQVNWPKPYTRTWQRLDRFCVVPAVPLSTTVTQTVAASDAAILPHYSDPLSERLWAPRIVAVVKQLKQHQDSPAILALQRSSPRTATTRRGARPLSSPPMPSVAVILVVMEI